MREPITKNLREYVDVLYEHGTIPALDHGVFGTIADRIDAEYRRRLDTCRENTKRAVIRYLRGVLTDYDRGVKRVRKGDATEVVRCHDCELAIDGDAGNSYICVGFASRRVDGDDYCSYGERKEDEDDE